MQSQTRQKKHEIPNSRTEWKCDRILEWKKWTEIRHESWNKATKLIAMPIDIKLHIDIGIDLIQIVLFIVLKKLLGASASN
jgi:hypothetical protein